MSGTARARRGSREMLVKALYQWQIGGTDEAELIEQFADTPEFARIDQVHFRRLLRGVLAETGALDSIIAAHAERSMAELDPVGRAVLLLAIEELRDCADVPTKVIINEGVELAKLYGAAESYRFVNAVLHKAAREIREHRQ